MNTQDTRAQKKDKPHDAQEAKECERARCFDVIAAHCPPRDGVKGKHRQEVNPKEAADKDVVRRDA